MDSERNIVLCGFMGCGKTTVGKKLAYRTGKTFVDTDTLIEERYGKTVSEIFEEKGESGFRAIETDICKELSQKNSLVISVGGGTLLNNENVNILSENGIIIFLDVPLFIIQTRLKYDQKRPLLQREDRQSFVAQLYQKRLPAYIRVCDIRIHGRTKKSSQIANLIMEKLKLKNIREEL